jgi:hypothetical protein
LEEEMAEYKVVWREIVEYTSFVLGDDEKQAISNAQRESRSSVKRYSTEIIEVEKEAE